MPYRNKHQQRWTVTCRDQAGKRVRLYADTESKLMAAEMENILRRVTGGMGLWPILSALKAGRITLHRLREVSLEGKASLQKLATEMETAGHEIEDLLDRWEGMVGRTVSHDTIERYRHAVEDAGFESTTDLNRGNLQRWLDGLASEVSGSTVRKRAAGVSSFCDWLVRWGYLPENPMRGISLPSPDKARTQHLTEEQVLLLAEACPEKLAACAITVAHGTGIEASVLCDLKVRDIDFKRKVVRARGTKNSWRDRDVAPAQWAWCCISQLAEGLDSDRLLLGGMDRHALSRHHRDAAVKAGFPDLQLRDARHSFAVRLVGGGVPYEVVARQLGHKDATMVMKVYGRFKPSAEELNYWESKATANHAEQRDIA